MSWFRPHQWGLLVAVVFLVGCNETSLSRRFDAEREVWRAERQETDWRKEFVAPGPEIDARVAELHERIEARFGAADPPGASALGDSDTVQRLRLAGLSAFRAADLRARTSSERDLAQEYGRIGRIYGFDHALRARARLGEGKVWEKVGERRRALDVYREYLERPGRFAKTSAPVSRVEQFDVDLEVHLGLLAADELGRSEARELQREARDRLQQTVKAWGDRHGATIALRRQAELSAVLGEAEQAIFDFDRLLETASSVDERAELLLLTGILFDDELDDADQAEQRYRAAARTSEIVRPAAEARLRLGELFVRERRAADGVEEIDKLLALGARVLENLESEALYWKARGLIALGQWEDAVPVLRRASATDPASPFALASAALYRERLARLRSGNQGEELFVTTAEAVPDVTPKFQVPRSWAETVRTQRQKGVWSRGLDPLQRLGREARDSEIRSRATAQSERLSDRRS